VLVRVNRARADADSVGMAHGTVRMNLSVLLEAFRVVRLSKTEAEALPGSQSGLPTRSSRRSITLVLVGPVLIKSPSGSKKW